MRKKRKNYRLEKKVRLLKEHLDMAEDAASNSGAMAYMSIHETLLLFTGIRFFGKTIMTLLQKPSFSEKQMKNIPLCHHSATI